MLRSYAYPTSLLLGSIATLLAMPSWPQAAAEATPQASVADLAAAQVSPPGLALARWINPATAPFIPVPVIAVDPNSGTTLGMLPTVVRTDENHAIRRIYAPDIVHNPDFGYGMHARVFAYPSQNEQWSVVVGAQQRIQRVFDAEYQTERLRKKLWSLNYSLIYNRDGTSRFFGIGNGTLKSAETNYTRSMQLAQLQIGLNLDHTWQLLYTLRPQKVDVSPGTLTGIATIGSRFAHISGLGSSSVLRNRMSIVYDTRDDLTVPRQGMQWVAYGGLASRSGVFNDSMYSEAGVDGRAFWPLDARTILAAHMALRYMPTTKQVPFWALSNIGGGEDEIGGEQELRGYGAGRFYDRDSFAVSVELRRTVASFNAVSTHVDLEFTPFVDLGRVFASAGTFPLARLHKVGGIAFRGIARPFVVGYVDIGYGSEGVAAFTGINYPF